MSITVMLLNQVFTVTGGHRNVQPLTASTLESHKKFILQTHVGFILH